MPTFPPSSDTPSAPITVVDYGAGNLRSVQRALEAVGQQVSVTGDAREVERAAGLVLPGVGSTNDAMQALHAQGLVEPLRAYAASGRPFFGVCVGLQLLFEFSEEGNVECLGILPGRVRRFPTQPGLKVPQIGWNSVWFTSADHPLLHGVPNGTYFYFVHSYYADPSEPGLTIGEAEYGVRFAAIVAHDNVVATQFHPEKSADLGLRIYANFAAIVAASQAPVVRS